MRPNLRSLIIKMVKIAVIVISLESSIITIPTQEISLLEKTAINQLAPDLTRKSTPAEVAPATSQEAVPEVELTEEQPEETKKKTEKKSLTTTTDLKETAQSTFSITVPEVELLPLPDLAMSLKSKIRAMKLKLLLRLTEAEVVLKTVDP